VGEEAVWGGGLFRPKCGLNIRDSKFILEIKVNYKDKKIYPKLTNRLL
jgi:hypothetical protein